MRGNNFRQNKNPVFDKNKINQPVTKDLYVNKIIFPAADIVTGYVIFAGKDENGTDIVCSGYAPGISSGEHVRVNGTWQLHHNKNTGTDQMQIVFNEIVSLAFETEEEIIRYFEGLKVPGCGKRTIKKIIEKYGTDTINFINDHSESFASEHIFGVSEKVLEDIRDTITEKLKARRAFSEMLKAGFSEKQSVLLSERYGGETENIFKYDKYLFALENQEIPFALIDKISLENNEYKIDDAKRFAAGIDYKVRENFNKGHVYSTWNEIREDVINELGLKNKFDDKKINAIFREAQGILQKRVNNLNEKYRKVRIYFSEYGEDDWHLYLNEIKDTEKNIAENIVRLCSHYSDSRSIDIARFIPDNLNLSKEQTDSVFRVFHNPVSIITGGPGTGKSYLAKAIYDTAVKCGLTCTAAAPTGKAAKRLEEAIFTDFLPDEEYRPQTIHKLLKATGEGSFVLGEQYPIPADVLIIDESSMIDINLAEALLRAVANRTRIVFMGDVNQLPSVRAGNFFEDLINTIEGLNEADETQSDLLKRIPVTRLNTVFRQKDGDSIILNSQRINDGKFPVSAWKFGLPDDNFFFFETGAGRGVPLTIECAAESIPRHFGFDPVRQVQVLVPTNIGRSGTDAINILLRDRLNPSDNSRPDYAVGSRTFRCGDKVMQTVNDYDLQVHNGDVGFIENINENGLTVFFPDANRSVYYSRSQTYKLVLAYAITVHKAQGAEFEAVVILIDDKNSQHVIKKQLYTAVTRAKNAVVLIGSRKAYQKALSDVNYVKRNTKLGTEITAAFAKAEQDKFGSK